MAAIRVPLFMAQIVIRIPIAISPMLGAVINFAILHLSPEVFCQSVSILGFGECKSIFL